MVRQNKIVAGVEFYVASETGIVTGTRFWKESKYIGKIFGTRVEHHHQIWIKEPNGNELFFDLEDRGDFVTEGDEVTVVCGARADGKDGSVLAIFHHMTRRECWAWRGKEEIMKAMRLPFGMSSKAQAVCEEIRAVRNAELKRLGWSFN